ncbi:MAG TPA: Uma2 family endonuclease [Thermoanaerobaculia bacterium]|nr:Uma2 family endonuclease [Thermoanaerobaculia bacterium]
MKELFWETERRPVTEEEFYAEQDEDSPYQFLGGKLVVREPASDLHEDLCAFLSAVMRIAFEERGGGVVRGDRYPMRLDPRWSPEPDVMVVREGRRQLIGPQRLEGPADLVIEIASPGDVRRALRLKLPRYHQARIPEIWVIDPWVGNVRVEVLEASEVQNTVESQEPAAIEQPQAAPTYRSREVTAGRLHSAVFPWFWIDVSWLWQKPLPPTLGCVRQILG